ncbi:MAG: alpha/beta hydrolase fold domain-containing protein [Akkermansiaceae bacterium]|nr:alpha/beta hydrolase fold domain-containing protein [Akkermansiaceae bacterium]
MRSIRLLVLVVATFASQAFSQPRILCLGDSITEGGSTFKVYRHVLAEKLDKAGIPVVFVGPKKDKAGLAHGGYGGKSIEQVAVEYGKFHAAHPADVVIIHSGHNHTVEEKPIPGIIRTAEEMITLARKDNPQVIILLAKVIPSGKLPKYEYIPELNKEIAKLAEKLKVTVVDQETGFDWKTDTIQDMVHPSASGAEKMGAKFFDALQPLLAKAPAAGATTVPIPAAIDALPETPQEALAKASKVLTYKTVDGLDLEMHVFLPDKPAADGKLRPGVLFIHGGGWVGGEPSVHAFESLHLSRQGMVCATIRYRLLGQGKKGKYSVAKSPGECLADAKSAMRFFRAHAAEFGMDPQRIAAGGGSAGGHLAAALNTIPGYDDPKDDLKVSPKADALVLLYPAFDLSGGWGGGIGSCKKAGMDPLKFSPATMADATFPKTLILVGKLDPVSPPASNTAFLGRMKKAGVSVELLTYAGKEHKLFERRKTDPHFQSYLIHSSRFFQELGWLPQRPLPPLPEVEHTVAK